MLFILNQEKMTEPVTMVMNESSPAEIETQRGREIPGTSRESSDTETDDENEVRKRKKSEFFIPC